MTTRCLEPVTDDTLTAWWAGELDDRAARRIEEHLLACPSCTARGQALATLALALRDAVRAGALAAIVTREVLERLRAEGLRIREYSVPPGGAVQCTVAPDDDIVAARLGAPGLSEGQVDLVVRVGDGPEMRLHDVIRATDAEEVILLPQVETLKAMPAHVQQLRLVLVTEAGERPVGEYTFDHSPWPA